MRVFPMGYIPNTDRDIEAMLKEIGADSADELFSSIPEKLRFTSGLGIPDGISEMELLEQLRALSGANASTHDHVSFLGGGAYNHFIPSLVGQLTGRSEFYTSYTPYQPEVSQGTLQAIFEYQSLMCMLTGMDVSNASLYDGSSAAAEAVLMSLRANRRDRVLVSRSVNPEYRAVIDTYLRANDREVVEIPLSQEGVTDIDGLAAVLDGSVSCVVVQSPNYFGIMEDLGGVESVVHGAGALFVAAFSEPLAFGILRPPGEYGADIVCGEGQSLGIPIGYGGPYLGILTADKRLIRSMPGRIVGKSVDRRGHTAYVLTLTAREQHIRRERATSNICTNQGLCALTATVYLAALGKRGFRDLAILNHERAEYARGELAKVAGITLKFPGPIFNEFVIQTDKDPALIEEKLARRGILPGIPLGRYHDELRDCMLVSVTEMNSTGDIDRLCVEIGSL
jgi:glycine dehydrogenase subunit 1